MKIIEAMRQSKDNLVKISDLQKKIAQNSANLDASPTEYGDGTKAQVASWVQSCIDLTQANVHLGVAIQRTNLATSVTLSIGGNDVTKTIAEWVLRRRIYASIDQTTWSTLTNKNLQPMNYHVDVDGQKQIKVSNVVLNYSPTDRDNAIAMYRSEPSLINSALEIVNATTDLIEA